MIHWTDSDTDELRAIYAERDHALGVVQFAVRRGMTRKQVWGKAYRLGIARKRVSRGEWGSLNHLLDRDIWEHGKAQPSATISRDALSWYQRLWIRIKSLVGAA